MLAKPTTGCNAREEVSRIQNSGFRIMAVLKVAFDVPGERRSHVKISQ